MINKLIRGEKITDEDIENELYEICDRVHSSCDNECPVYKKNGGALTNGKNWEENRGCDCFKNGKAMLKYLRENI